MRQCAVNRLRNLKIRHSYINLPRRFQSPFLQNCRLVSHKHGPQGSTHDPRLEDLGQVIEDRYAIVREKYTVPKHPVVLAHGLLGFNELHPAGRYLPAIHYWSGIQEALSLKGVEVITAAVPPSGSIEERARVLERYITVGARGKNVNIIAHSMTLTWPSGSGLDARYMISHLRPDRVKVLSLTTIATPHRGSSIADYILTRIGDERLPQVYYLLNKIKVQTGAFGQLTRKFMEEKFNPGIPDVEGVRYFSYGASMHPSLWSIFRLSHRFLQQVEGANDGLVSVRSSKWGTYKGTLLGVSHLDLINWTNRLKWLLGEITGHRRKFNAIAFYLAITDMLAKEGF